MFQHIEDVRMQAVMPVPSKDNDWLGFCISAIKLQNGDKKVRTAPSATCYTFVRACVLLTSSQGRA